MEYATRNTSGAWVAARWLVFACVLFVSCGLAKASLAGDSLSLQVAITLAGEPVQLGQTVTTATGDSVRIDKLRFYLGTLEGQPDARYHLIDLADPSTLSFRAEVTDDRLLTLRFGIDSLTNHQGAHGDDLDPSRGMYWAWQSGYIDCKLEGQRAGTDFTYHLGGFLGGLGSSHTFQLTPKPHSVSGPNAVLTFDLAAMLAQPDIKPTLMRPSASSLVLAKAFTQTATLTW